MATLAESTDTPAGSVAMRVESTGTPVVRTPSWVAELADLVAEPADSAAAERTSQAVAASMVAAASTVVAVTAADTAKLIDVADGYPFGVAVLRFRKSSRGKSSCGYNFTSNRGTTTPAPSAPVTSSLLRSYLYDM